MNRSSLNMKSAPRMNRKRSRVCPAMIPTSLPRFTNLNLVMRKDVSSSRQRRNPKFTSLIWSLKRVSKKPAKDVHKKPWYWAPYHIDNKINGSDIAKLSTPLAAVTAKTAAGADTVYVYFVDSSSNLQRSTYGEKSSPFPERVKSGSTAAPPVAVWSQLAVTAGAKHNFVSYITEKAGKQLLTIFADERL